MFGVKTYKRNVYAGYSVLKFLGLSLKVHQKCTVMIRSFIDLVCDRSLVSVISTPIASSPGASQWGHT